MELTGIELIAKERQEQIEKHNRSIESDVENNADCELAAVATALAYPYHYADDSDNYPENWDKDLIKRMVSKPYKERLIIAGALLVAEIDRLNAINPTNSK